MPSENAKAVAQEVIARVRKGKKVKLGEIIRKQGYSDSISLSPTKITRTQSYKEEIRPIVERWQREIQRIQTQLESTDLEKEKYKDLVDSVDKLNKQVQLATGGNTEQVKIMILPAEVVNKYELTSGTERDSE